MRGLLQMVGVLVLGAETVGWVLSVTQLQQLLLQRTGRIAVHTAGWQRRQPDIAAVAAKQLEGMVFSEKIQAEPECDEQGSSNETTIIL